MTQSIPNLQSGDAIARCPACLMPVKGPHLSGCPYISKVSAQEGASQRRGVKLDQGKPPIYRGVIQQFPLALEAVAHHTLKGNAEPGHTWLGWQAVENGFTRYSDALARHMVEEAKLDPSQVEQRLLLIEETTAVAWNSLARLEHLLRDTEE